LRLRGRAAARRAAHADDSDTASAGPRPARLRHPLGRSDSMSRTSKTVTAGDQITTLLTTFTLTTAARELVSRFVEADQQAALPVLLAVLELEADERRARRVTRLRRPSKLPPGKTFDTLDEGRLPPALVRKLRELGDGDFLSEATNV